MHWTSGNRGHECRGMEHAAQPARTEHFRFLAGSTLDGQIPLQLSRLRETATTCAVTDQRRKSR